MSGQKSPLFRLATRANPRRPVLDPSRSKKATTGINLRSVAEALIERGLDPAVELVRVVQEGKLEPEVHARFLNELLQYTQPKLKSVEVKAKIAATAFDVNDDQARRIAEEFLKATT